MPNDILYRFANGETRVSRSVIVVMKRADDGRIEIVEEALRKWPDELRDIDPKWQWVAKDKNGEVWAFTNKPKMGNEMWGARDQSDDMIVVSEMYPNLDLSDDWRHSLIARNT